MKCLALDLSVFIRAFSVFIRVESSGVAGVRILGRGHGPLLRAHT